MNVALLIKYLCSTAAIIQNNIIVKLLYGPLWKQVTYTLKSLLGPFESKVLTHYNCCWQHLWKQGILQYSCCWGAVWKQGTYTLQLLFGASLKV